MWETTDGMWAIKYTGAGRPWLHNGTVRRTRAEAIAAIIAHTFPEKNWKELKEFLKLEVVRVTVTEVMMGLKN